jgi:gamma-glutamyltranspeptidase
LFAGVLRASRTDRRVLSSCPWLVCWRRPALNRPETTFLCAADSSGMMVSLIQSNYTGFGSGYTIPSPGFCLQDRGNLFDLQSGRPNSLEPGKRPFHTIIPDFVTKEGQPLTAFGLMGGDMQPPTSHPSVPVRVRPSIRPTPRPRRAPVRAPPRR